MCVNHQWFSSGKWPKETVCNCHGLNCVLQIQMQKPQLSNVTISGDRVCVGGGGGGRVRLGHVGGALVIALVPL